MPVNGVPAEDVTAFQKVDHPPDRSTRAFMIIMASLDHLWSGLILWMLIMVGLAGCRAEILRTYPAPSPRPARGGSGGRYLDQLRDSSAPTMINFGTARLRP